MTHSHLNLRLPEDTETGQASEVSDVAGQRAGTTTRASTTRTADGEEVAASAAAPVKAKKAGKARKEPDVAPSAPEAFPPVTKTPATHVANQQTATGASAAQATRTSAGPTLVASTIPANPQGQPAHRVQPAPPAPVQQDLAGLLRESRLRAVTLQAEIHARDAQYKAREAQLMTMLQQNAVDGMTAQLATAPAPPAAPVHRVVPQPDLWAEPGAANHGAAFSMVAPDGVVAAAERVATAKDTPPPIEIGYTVDPMNKGMSSSPSGLSLPAVSAARCPRCSHVPGTTAVLLSLYAVRCAPPRVEGLEERGWWWTGSLPEGGRVLIAVPHHSSLAAKDTRGDQIVHAVRIGLIDAQWSG